MSKKTSHQIAALKRKAPPKASKVVYIKVMTAVPVMLFRHLTENYEDPQLAANELLNQSILSDMKKNQEQTQ